jgi:type IV secretion system protein TrbL
MRVTRQRLVVCAGLVAVVATVPAWGQTTDPSGMLSQYQSAQTNWQNAIAPYAIDLFKLLATCDFAWTCITIALEKQDMQGAVAAIIKKLMTIGIFWILLAYAPTWFPAIIQSFVQIGGSASGMPVPMNPSDIMTQGLTIAGTLWNAAATNTSLLTNPVSGIVGGIALLVAGIVIVGCYLIITIHFIMAMVESYLVLGAGYIFLGFGGSRWTSNYTERYISLVVSVGARLMVLYLVIGVGQLFAQQWIVAVQTATTPGTNQFTIVAVFTIAAQVVIYAIICWIVPKIAGNVIGGTLSVSGGDAFAAGAMAATAAIAAGSVALAATGVGAPVAAGGAAVAGAASAAGAAGATGAAGAAGTAAAGTAAAGTAAGAGAAGFGGAAVTPAVASGTGAGAGGFTSAAAPATTGASAMQPPPPVTAMASSSGAPGAGGGAPAPAGGGGGGSSPSAGRSVVQPPPPAAELASSGKGSSGIDVEKIASKLKQGVDGTVGRAPEGPTISGAGLSIGHAPE